MLIVPLPMQQNPVLVPRHGSHHFANLKYGYIVFFFIDLLYPLYLWITQRVYNKRWAQTGRSTSNLRIVSVPLPIKIILWLCITALLGFWNLETGAEFTVHIKRFGRIAYLLLPLDIFLTFKPSPIPLNNYLDLLTLHKWLSRLIVVCAFFHAIGFFIKWSINGTISSKSGSLLNVLGIVVFGFFSLLFIVSIKPIRRWFYSLFYLFHMITVWVTVFFIGFHARPGVTFYSVICVLLLLYQFGHKIKTATSISKISSKRPDGASLSLITISRSNLPGIFSPASHLRMSQALTNPNSWLFPSHPYTIASLPLEADIKLIVRESKFQIHPFDDYTVWGPYESVSLNFFQTAENICIICGGSGISFGLPIYNHFKKASVDFVSIKLVWVTRNKNDLYLLKDLNVKGIEIYISRELEGLSQLESSSDIDQFLINESDSDADARGSMDSFDLELNPFNDPKKVVENSSTLMGKNMIHYGSRPNLDICFKKNLSKTADNANKWVIACGSESLIKDAKRFSKKNGTRFLSEVYAM